jgi:uncharacterized protein involved in exopolysaccharide biosynthesis
MTYKEIQNILKEKFGATRPADIAREFGVTPQVVSNWKNRNQVPYKYVLVLRKKINLMKVDDEYGLKNNALFKEEKNEHNQENKFETINIFLNFYKLILSNILIICFIPIVFLVSTHIYIKYFKEYIYISQATILPISDNSGVSGLENLAQQFGVSLSSNKGNRGLTSSIMFPEILKSRMLAKEILNKKFRTAKYMDSLKLINILMEKPEKKKWLEIEKTVAISKLRRLYKVQVKRNNPLLSITISTFDPHFSADLGKAIISVLKLTVDKINLSQIKEKKIFIRNRIKEVSDELVKAEESLKDFRMGNRNINSSPALLLEQERLIRNEEVKTQIFINLKNQYEIARIEEVGGGRMFQVLDYPEPAPGATGINNSSFYYLSIILGLIVAIGIILGFEWYMSNKEKIKVLM